MSAGLAPPPLAVFEAPAHWRSIEFLSDLHLCADTPRTLDALTRHLRSTDADAIVVLGDLFEVWVGDDVRFSPFEQACMQVLHEASKHHYLAFIAGNRDFLVGGDFLHDAGMQGWADPTLLKAFGSSVLLTHGDALCLSDTRYQQFRQQVRGAAWQTSFLSQTLAERQAQARQMRDASEQGREHQTSWGDIDVPCALSWLDAAGSGQMIHGHTHHPSHDRLDSGHARWVLSDWDFEGSEPRADVLRWTAAGIERRQPAG